ncbi:putative methyl transferase [Sulfurimonas denitrificans DSM 1251]|jgi:malonyl-CoA O-methyltransferase|uniref:Putative methyl transferase n=1 Tax=Sulfurimonas denitrificans (strain ATCC 33889 / DSM 1251) TaxID=326298 RepID=Q30NU5_SULDN|nr:methyltransferase domain-containing protein [Sulfurimonas denitrificans]ABB45336.1 putative methyl transferase [Sulfurimonas denitrificans DSM 1251]MDD3442615.1 methyltransferase domain-containing protein [Sulfurimonas denitrificans]
MNISSEFSKHALEYGSYNIIQNIVIEKLLLHVESKPKKILDIGCGSGALLSAIDWDYEFFCGVDFAKGMLELHPKSPKIELLYTDFNKDELFDNMLTCSFDFVFSASALQWADDLERIFSKIKGLKAPIALAIFTAGTFKSINETASISSILKSANEIKELQEKYFDANFEVQNYKLEFESTRDIFKYIKKSGVSGSRKVLNYKESKKLLRDYPLNYLEFEVAFIYTSKR